jgi:hypothetical protein
MGGLLVTIWKKELIPRCGCPAAFLNTRAYGDVTSTLKRRGRRQRETLPGSGEGVLQSNASFITRREDQEAPKLFSLSVLPR